MPRADFRTPRLYVDAVLAAGGAVPLAPEQSNYLGNVLRLKSGDTVLVFNGRDGEWRAAIAGRKRPEQLVIDTQTRPQEAPTRVRYAFAPLKHARLDYMVQKAVEMGAAALCPVLTQHTQVSRINLERMHANVIEAAEQCGILTIAAVEEPKPLDRFLHMRDANRLLVFCDEDAETDDPIAVLEAARRTGRDRRRRADRPGRRFRAKRARPLDAPGKRRAAVARPAHPPRRHRSRRRPGAGAGGAWLTGAADY